MQFRKIVFILISACLFFQCYGKGGDGSQMSDSERFVLEYPLVGGGNIFVYRNADETADILANGRGIVFIGFKECPWCQLYAVFLHAVALEMEIDTIYYCDIKEDRESNSESYRRIVGILSTPSPV